MRRFLNLTTALICFAVSPALAQPQGGGATPVIVANVEKKTFNDEVEALGTLKANESVDLTSAVTEIVTVVKFEDNQRVKKGDILVEMDAAEELAELAEQNSFLSEAQRQVKRLEPVVQKGAASASALDEKRREYQAAKARVDAIQSRINQRIIKAPYDGILGLRNISVGALAQPGSLITTIDDDSVMKLDFAVPEIFISSLKPGVMITAKTSAYPDQDFEGEIYSVDSRIDPVTRSLIARALIQNQDAVLKPGLLMHVELEKNPRQAIVIPEEALIPEGSKQFVLVIEKKDGMTTAKKTRVEIGERQFGGVEILKGLIEGQQIVTHGTLRVRPGTPLHITAVEEGNKTLKEMMDQKPMMQTEETK